MQTPLDASAAPGAVRDAPARRGRGASGARGFRLRALALFVLCFAAPGSAELVRDVVTQATCGECCEDPCEDGAAEDCPASCAHCRCCAHPSAVPTGSLALPGAPPPDGLGLSWRTDDAPASGHRSPPFKPPPA